MTVRNVERTGKRRVTRLSTVARKVEHVRGIDIDYVQYCRRCLKPQAFCESKPWHVPDREWDQMRRHAAYYGHNAVAMLVVEPDVGPVGVKIFYSSTGLISPIIWGGEEHLQRSLEHARDCHECY